MKHPQLRDPDSPIREQVEAGECDRVIFDLREYSFSATIVTNGGKTETRLDGEPAWELLRQLEGRGTVKA